MKNIITALAALTLSFAANAADPAVKAECAAIFHGISVSAERLGSPQVAVVARQVKARLMSSAESQIGLGMTNRYYANKLSQMTAKLQADRGGDGIVPEELRFCIQVAQSYKFM